LAEYRHPELRNLVDDLSEEELSEIASTVVEDFRADWQSGSEWRIMHADWVKQYYQQDKPKNPPWEGASTESIPMMAEACNQFHARAFQAMFPNKNIIKGTPMGKADSQSKQRAERVSRHMSWQLMTKDRSYKRNKDRMLLGLPLHGSVFTKTYFDPVKKRNVTENVRAIDLVVPYGTGPRDLEDLERKTQVIHMPMHKAAWLKQAGFFSEMPEPESTHEKSEQDMAHDEVSGFNESGTVDRNPARIIEQHRFLDLDEDDVPEPYIVWVDATTEKVLRISIRWDTDEVGEPTDGKQPVEYFTHYTFLENPDGFYGLGYGHLLGPINTAVNKLIRQVIDAGTLANVGNHSGFISEALAVKKGDVNFELGVFKKVANTNQDIRQGIYQFQFPGPNATHFNIAEMLMSRGDRLATVTEAVTGQTEKVMQPTTILALIEQSLQVFSTVYERVLSSWTVELEKHYRLNRKHMDPKEYFAINDIGGALEQFETSREDYADDLQVEPIADPKMSTDRQKMARAEAELQTTLQNPLAMNDPQALYNAYKRYFVAIGSDNIEEILPNMARMQLPRVDDPVMENRGALSPVPMMPTAFPDQDHQMHIQAHMQLLNDPMYGRMLSDVARQELNEHIQAHAAFLYGMVENTNGIGPGGPGLGQMAPAAGNPGVPQPNVPTVPGDASLVNNLVAEPSNLPGAGAGA
jgi:hypothetical protein